MDRPTRLMDRRTKIIATIGPASDSEAALKGLIHAGMDVARLGLAHESLETALERFHRIRRVAADVDRPIGILVDLPGPKVRLGQLPDGGFALTEGEEVLLEPGDGPSSTERLTVSYDQLLRDVQVEDALTFGDGAVVARVVAESSFATGALLTGALTTTLIVALALLPVPSLIEYPML